MRKPSAYVRDITRGHWTSTGNEAAPTLPKGMQPPTGNATLATHRALALLTLGDPDAEDAEKQGESLPLPGFAATGIKTTGTDPESVEQARKLDDWPAWDASIKKELDQHKKMGTWILVEPPPDINIVGSRLVLHYKHDATRAIVSRKS